MALIKCGECGQQMSDRAMACPHCGAPATPKRALVALSLWLAGTLMAALLVGVLVLRNHGAGDADPASAGILAGVVGVTVLGLAVVLLVLKLRGGR